MMWTESQEPSRREESEGHVRCFWNFCSLVNNNLKEVREGFGPWSNAKVYSSQDCQLQRVTIHQFTAILSILCIVRPC